MRCYEVLMGCYELAAASHNSQLLQYNTCLWPLAPILHITLFEANTSWATPVRS